MPDACWIKIGKAVPTPAITQPVISVVVGLNGERNGYVFLLLEEGDLLDLLGLIMDPKGLGDLERSAFMEMGNILAGTFIGALSQFLRIRIMEKPPFMRIGTVSTLLSDVLEMHTDNSVWLASVRFEIEKGHPEGYILFVPFFDFRRDAMARIK